MVKVDLHVHTEYSGDSKTSLKRAVISAKEKGLDGIGITDHNTVEGLEEARKLGKEEDLLIIPGIEISTKDGHVLGLGIKEKIERDRPAKETIKEIHKQGGLAIAAHPYGFVFHHHTVGDLIKELDFDAVEVFNSRNLVENKKAIGVATELDLVQVAGSDAHLPGEIGKSYTIANCKPTQKEFLNKIKEGDILWIGKRTSMFNDFRSEADYNLRRFYNFFKKE